MDRLNLRHLARLARLQLDPAQEEGLSRDLEGILAFFQSLENLDTEGIEPAPRPFPLPGRLREDQAGPVLERERVLENAPDQAEGFFRVPPVLEEKEDS